MKNDSLHTPATILQRIKAFIADMIVVTVPAIFVWSILPGPLTSSKIFADIFTLIADILIFLYFYYFTYKKNGVTLGKRLIKIKVIGKDGGKLSVNAVLKRYGILLGLVIFAPALFSMAGADEFGNLIVGLVAVALVISIYTDKKKRGFHDRLSDTQVVKA